MARQSEKVNGSFYVIQLAPDIAPGRVKLGRTKDVQARLSHHRCSAPTAVLVKSWVCDVQREYEAIQVMTRVGCTRLSREVFDCTDLDGLLARGDRFFAENPATEPMPIVVELIVVKPPRQPIAAKVSKPVDVGPSAAAARAFAALRPVREYVCAVCEKPFLASGPKARTCSTACRSKSYYRAKAARDSENASESTQD